LGVVKKWIGKIKSKSKIRFRPGLAKENKMQAKHFRGFLAKALSVVLVLTFLVALLPQPAQAAQAPKEAPTTLTTATVNSSDGNFEINLTRLSNNKILIEITNATKKTIYYIKVAADRGYGLNWTKLGRLRVRKEATISKIYRLPAGFRNVKYITVCFKNAVSDAVVCKTLSNK
jgi:hypothetical protein